MEQKKIIIGINIFLAAVMFLFILHYYHFYYHRPMFEYFGRKAVIERCYGYLTSNYSIEEIQRLSLYELLNTEGDFPFCFISLTEGLPSNIEHAMSKKETFDQYIGYHLYKGDNTTWILMERSPSMRTGRLAISSDGTVLEFREK